MTIQEQYENDAVNIAPHLHEVVYEDEKMRVLKVHVEPCDIAEMHWHPRNINYVLSSGRLLFEKPDGTSAEVELREGQVTSALEEGSHSVKNIGNSIVETIQVELKQ